VTDDGGRIVRICEPLDGRDLCVFLLVGDDGAVLVDTGVAATPARTIAPALANAGLAWSDLSAVIVTHADVDHSGGLGAVRRFAPSAPTLAGSADKPLIESVEVLLDRRYREFVPEHGVDQEQEFVAWVRDNADDGTIDSTLDSGQRMRIDDGWSVDVLTVPGHTAGHLAIHDPASGTTIVADAVLGAGLPGSSGPTSAAPTYRYVAAYRATIARLRSLCSQRLLCSHLEPMQGEAVSAYLDESEQFCDRLEQAVIEVLATRGPSTLAELIDAVAPHVATWPEAANGTLAQPLAGHLEDLCTRGVIERSTGRPARFQTIEGGRVNATG
jgi:glyoxylase-like metal-dependent hydrolase (beta-lactamase superfamily II)